MLENQTLISLIMTEVTEMFYNVKRNTVWQSVVFRLLLMSHSDTLTHPYDFTPTFPLSDH